MERCSPKLLMTVDINGEVQPQTANDCVDINGEVQPQTANDCVDINGEVQPQTANDCGYKWRGAAPNC